MSLSGRVIAQKLKKAKVASDVSQVSGGITFPIAHFTGSFSPSQAILKNLPWWIIIHGLIQAYEGYLIAKKGPDKFYSKNENKYRGLLKTLSNLYAAESGAEILKGGILSQAPGLPLLFFRCMITSGLEFLAALEHLRRVLSHDEEAGIDPDRMGLGLPQSDDVIAVPQKYVPLGNANEIFDAFANVFEKGFACLGWSSLYFLGMSNPLGWAFLITSAAITLLKYAIPRISNALGFAMFALPDRPENHSNPFERTAETDWTEGSEMLSNKDKRTLFSL